MLTKRILVVGMTSFDAGKTLLATRIAAKLKSDGYRVHYFKPVSGHNYWHHNNHTQRCLEDRLLYSRDAYRINQVLAMKMPMELVNPVHTLYVPWVLDSPRKSGGSILGLSGWDAILTLRRYSCPIEGKINRTILMAADVIQKKQVLITENEVQRRQYYRILKIRGDISI